MAEKRAVGYKYDAEARVLARFEEFNRREFPGLDTLTEASVHAWIAAARGRRRRPATLAGLVAPVREPLAGWAAAVPGLPAPGGAAQAHPVRPAHLHRRRTGGAVRPDRPLSLLRRGPGTAPGHAGAVPHDLRLRPARLGARLLRVADVDLDTGVLQIRDAKGGKDRQVPVCDALRVRLAGYHVQVTGRADREWFFPGSRPGQPLTLGNVYHNFRRFLWQAHISHGGPGHGPRVHDLRHTMAVNNLRSWFAAGRDVGALLPVLQTYLGHSSIADTGYYLHLTAESYPDITARVQQVIGDVVPPSRQGR